MTNGTSTIRGIELFVEKCRNEFRRSENTDYYTESYYNIAERKYVKYCLYGKPKS